MHKKIEINEDDLKKIFQLTCVLSTYVDLVEYEEDNWQQIAQRADEELCELLKSRMRDSGFTENEIEDYVYTFAIS